MFSYIAGFALLRTIILRSVARLIESRKPLMILTISYTDLLYTDIPNMAVKIATMTTQMTAINAF
jgi:hypothetical protein